MNEQASQPTKSHETAPMKSMRIWIVGCLRNHERAILSPIRWIRLKTQFCGEGPEDSEILRFSWEIVRFFKHFQLVIWEGSVLHKIAAQNHEVLSIFHEFGLFPWVMTSVQLVWNQFELCLLLGVGKADVHWLDKTSREFDYFDSHSWKGSKSRDKTQVPPFWGKTDVWLKKSCSLKFNEADFGILSLFSYKTQPGTRKPFNEPDSGCRIENLRTFLK